MFKKIGMITLFIIVWSNESQGCLQTITIPAKDFCAGNSLVIITRDSNGLEQVSGCVSFDEGKTQYSQEEISQHHIALVSINDQPQAIVSDVQQNQNVSHDDDVLIYLHFQVDTHLNIIRVLVIKNNLLADNPFDVVEYSAHQLMFGDEDDDDDFFGSFNDSDLTFIDLTNVKTAEPIKLSYYDTAVLAAYVVWTMQAAYTQELYNSMLEWFKSKYAE